MLTGLHFKGISSESHLNFIQTVWGEQRITILERLSQRASKDAIPFWCYLFLLYLNANAIWLRGEIFQLYQLFFPIYYYSGNIKIQEGKRKYVLQGLENFNKVKTDGDVRRNENICLVDYIYLLILIVENVPMSVCKLK